MPTPFDPIEVGGLQVANRLAMAPVKTALGTTTGLVTDRLVEFVRRRARGGVGLVITEPLYVERSGAEHPKQLGVDRDETCDGLRRLAEAVRGEGAAVFAHLNHAGRAANPKASGTAPVAPSRVRCASTGVEPEVLTEEDIERLVEAFAGGGRRARDAGFDGVELQLGLGYLVAQFLSPTTNLREDGYGPSPEGRYRFAEEVFSAVRRAVGDGFPIGARISASEQSPGGLGLEDAQELARRVERWGAALVHVVTGTSCEAPPWYFQHMALPPGVNESLAAEVKKVVSVPVMAAGRLGDPERLRKVLDDGAVDMVGLGRPLLADPDLPRKLREGRDDEVLLCGQCLQGCLVGVKSGRGIGCNINPHVGHEQEPVVAAERPRHVVVVGGGPAGMQAAITASQRGHRVTLLEKDELGGQLALAHLPPGKRGIERTLRSMVGELERAGVEVRLGEAATVESVLSLEPDAVVVATGSVPATIAIPGLDRAWTARQVLRGSGEPGDKVLVLGGGTVGMEVAEHLASKGRSCVVVEVLDDVAGDMDPLGRKLMLKRLASLPVQVETGTRLLRMEGGRATVESGGEERELGAFDDVVMTVGARSHDPLSAPLREAGLEVVVAGDAEAPGNVVGAVTAGHRAAMGI